MSVIAAIASALRGEQFIHEDEESRAQKARIGVQSAEELGDDEEPLILLDLAGEADGVEPLPDRAGSLGPSARHARPGHRARLTDQPQLPSFADRPRTRSNGRTRRGR
jgi:hypothetical protein